MLRRHAVELHDLRDDEAAAPTRDTRDVGEALRGVAGTIETNLGTRGDAIPHLRFSPRYAGDRFEGRPIGSGITALGPGDFRGFVSGLRAALAEEERVSRG